MHMAGRILVALSRGIDRLASALAMSFLVVLVGAVMTQVIARYVLQSPPAWTEELARYTMIWAGLMGATMSFKRRFDPALIGSASADRPAWLSALAGGIQGLAVLIYLLPILWFSFFGLRLCGNSCATKSLRPGRFTLMVQARLSPGNPPRAQKSR